ncbi:hypothetical protein BDM02DRAFT_3115682 [Thelephora ganbajun]|uniref:Uncharacterized protein n=1 Tax=Thelephora ganbajun TaxID=370292 RepID=A0ACB6ZFH7_THEGA|nr:hypothetical protein BDM02DRAFT_3115682 [Thelephora ganbajun]
MSPPSNQTDVKLLHDVGTKLVQETSSCNPPISTVKSLEADVGMALALLRRRINSHESPNYRLYPELLLLIASRLTTDDLVKASHISYHWRAVLLVFPSLWSTLDLTHPNRAFAFLTRSKSAKIHVFFPRLPRNTSFPLESLEQSAERIATLQVVDYLSQKELLLRTMPSLRTLQLYMYRSSALLYEQHQLCFPALETLFVYGVDPPLFSVLETNEC